MCHGRFSDGIILPTYGQLLDAAVTSATDPPNTTNLPPDQSAPDTSPAGEALRLSGEAFATAFHFCPTLILISTRAEGRCLDVNEAFLRYTGYTRDEIIGHTTRELGLWVRPEDRDNMLSQLARYGTVRDLEVEYRKRSGATGFAVFYATPITIAGAPCLLTMAQDVTAYKQTQVALQNRNEELDAFARTVAHDLKSPLGNIIGFSEYLQARPNLPEATRIDFINTIVRNAFKMDSIIDELLLLAKVRVGSVPLQPLDMGRIVSEALHRLTFVIAENHAAIYAPDHWPTAVGYAPWAEEVWMNYLSNAIKYGGQPPHIQLGGERQADGLVRFWVKDDGPGLPAELETQLFQPFPQLSTVRATGHGLGLSIARQIVEKMGGQVGVDNAPGGCRFWFTLPSAG